MADDMGPLPRYSPVAGIPLPGPVFPLSPFLARGSKSERRRAEIVNV